MPDTNTQTSTSDTTLTLNARVTIDVTALSAEWGIPPERIPAFVQAITESGTRGYDTMITFTWDTPDTSEQDDGSPARN